MLFCFITTSNIEEHANMKRAFGMARELVRLEHKVLILLEDHNANRQIAKAYSEVEFVFFRKMGALAECMWKRRWVGKVSNGVLIVCGHSVRNFVIGTSRRRSVLLLDHPEIVSAFEEFSLARRAWEYLREWIELFFADGHLAVSRYLERRLRRRLRMLGLGAPVLYSPFAAEQALGEGRASRVGAEGGREGRGKHILLYVGSFKRAYGFYDMLEAAKGIRARRADFVLVLAGSGPELEGGVKFREENGLGGVVEFPGFLSGEELETMLNAADGFLCPMRDCVRDWARCPGKLYIYAAAGKPTITCRIGEAIEIWGDRGLYYRPGDVESLVLQMESVLDGGDERVAHALDGKLLYWDQRCEELLSWIAKSFCGSKLRI